jgi:hypothetical protein
VNIIVMVNTSVVPHTDVSNGFASDTFGNTSYWGASVDCSVSTSAAGPDVSFMVTQQLDGIN